MKNTEQFPWRKIDPSYTLPAGVTEICSVQTKERGSYCYVYIGTDKGVYMASVTDQRKSEEAKPVGLEEHSIVNITMNGSLVIVKTGPASGGDMYEIHDFILRGER